MRSALIVQAPLVLVVLAACWTSHATSPAVPPTTPPALGATTPPAPPQRTSCPATYALARGTCASGPGCTYPEGSCSCVPQGPVECRGGAAVRPDPNPDPTPPPPPPPLAWQCTPTVRADGCPGVQPDGATCTTEGKQCSYGTCCVTSYTCNKGQWGITMMACPP